MSAYVVCLVTIDDIDKAVQMAKTLVNKRLVACVNVMAEIRSIYSWQGRVCDEKEWLMIMKTRRELFPELQAAVKELHPYDVPEIISLPIDQGLPEYLRWVDESTSSTS